jgi:hypothetical protein
VQTILTFIATVKSDRLDELKALLQKIDQAPAGQYTNLPFASLTNLHFASLVIFEDPLKNFDPYLVFENNFEGTLENHLDELYRHGGVGLHEMYGHCLDYAATGPQDKDGILSFLRARVVRPDAYHIGNVGRSAERIRQEGELKYGIERFLDDRVKRGLAQGSPASIRNDIQEEVKRDQELAILASNNKPRMTFAERFVPWARLIGLGLLVLLLLPVLFPFIIIYLIALRIREKRDRSEIPPPVHGQVQQLMSREDRIVQNHMASLCYVKPGRFRRATIRFVLWVTNLVARVSYKGKLSGLTTLHFAHWVLIDNGHRLLFLTNYDGSWENYLDDFIDKAALGLTGIWSNTEDFPRTRFLVFGGARDAPRFKAIARHTQAYTNVWYSAYPRLTVRSIDNNSAIHEDLLKPLDETATRRWLWRF